MAETWKRLKSTILSSVRPKVDNLGPDNEHVPKKIKINNPLPDLKNVTCKIDNEGLNIIHLPKDVRVNKGVPKLESVKPKVDFKGIEIFHGTPGKKPSIDNDDNTGTSENIQDVAEDEDIVHNEQTETVSDPYEDYFLPFTPTFSRPASSSSTSLPSTPPSKTPSLPSSTSQTGIYRYNNRSPHTIAPTELLVSPKSLNLSQGSLKPRLPTPPDSPEIILSFRKSPPIITPKPTPPPPVSRVVQVSPIPGQDIFAQTDVVSYHDFNDQTEFEEPKKAGKVLTWWQWLLLILFIIVVFIGVGLAIGYAVGLFGKKVKCSDGYVKIDNTCHAQTTTPQPTTCDGCNCPKDILLDPDSSDNTFEVLSPRYPEKYRHNSDCVWNLMSTRGQLEITFTKFNLEWARDCRDKDYVFLDQVNLAYQGLSYSLVRRSWALGKCGSAARTSRPISVEGASSGNSK